MTAPESSLPQGGPTTAQTPTPRWGLLPSVGAGVKLGLLIVLAFQIVHICCLDNVHVVLSGELYRTGQLSGDELSKIVRRLGVRTVVNLRGACAGRDWYVEESKAGAYLGISHEDICLSAGHMPAVQEIRRLAEVIERSEPPLLVHCFRGVDRTGLAAMLALLLKTETPIAEARRSMSLRYLHLSFGRTGQLDVFINLYENWLTSRDLEHTPDRFRYWLNNEYQGHTCTGRIEVLGTVVRGATALQSVVPDQTLALRPNGRLRVKVPSGTPFGLRVRFHNTSDQTWRFHPAENVGVHATMRYTHPNGIPGDIIRAGRFHSMVAPGESIDLTFPLGPVGSDYRQCFQIEMIEEGHCFFHEVGMPYLNVELEAS